MKHKGQSLIELLIAVSAATVALVALTALATKSVSNQTFSRIEVQATQRAQEQIDLVRKYRDKNGFAALSTLSCSGVNTCYADQNVVTAGTVTTGSVTTWFQSTISNGTATVTVTARWTDGSGTHQSQLTTYLSDWSRQ